MHCRWILYWLSHQGSPEDLLKLGRELGMGESEFKMLHLEVSSNILPSICWFVTNRWQCTWGTQHKAQECKLSQPQGYPSLKGFRIVFSRWSVHPKGSCWDKNSLYSFLPLIPSLYYRHGALSTCSSFLWGLAVKLLVPSRPHWNWAWTPPPPPRHCPATHTPVKGELPWSEKRLGSCWGTSPSRST